MTNNGFTFQKEERLNSKIIIEELFSEGRAFVKYPLRCSYITLTEQQGAEAQVLISIPKKRFKRANKRNLLKRKVREAYRLNKLPLMKYLKEKQLQIAIAFVYLPTEVMSYQDIEKGLKKCLDQIIQQLSKAETHDPKATLD